MSSRRNSSVKRGIPALVCVETGKYVLIDGKYYAVLKLAYDISENYMPYAMPLNGK